MFAPVGPAALCIAVLGFETARAALHLGQHRIAMQAHIAQRLVRSPVLQLALLVAIPHTAASSAPLHLLLDLAALVAHAVFVTHIDRVAIGLLNMLAGSSKTLSKNNRALALMTKHILVDDERLLIPRDGLLVMLELVEQEREVVQRGCVLRVVGAVKSPVKFNCLLVAGNSLPPLVYVNNHPHRKGTLWPKN